MQTAKEINSHLKNIDYYTKEIQKLVQQQKEMDWDTDLKLSLPSNRRFMALNIIDANCLWIQSLLKGIHTNVLAIIEGEKVGV